MTPPNKREIELDSDDRYDGASKAELLAQYREEILAYFEGASALMHPADRAFLQHVINKIRKG